jgi:hypothetical protein
VNPFEAPDSPANSESLDRQNALDAPQPPEIPNPDLVTIVRELDKHVGADGWDQAPRLFALVPTADLIAREPSIAATLGIDESAAPLTPIEQEPLPGDRPLDDVGQVRVRGLRRNPDSGDEVCEERCDVALVVSSRAELGCQVRGSELVPVTNSNAIRTA